jgi:hypothetical protein
VEQPDQLVAAEVLIAHGGRLKLFGSNQQSRGRADQADLRDRKLAAPFGDEISNEIAEAAERRAATIDAGK